MALHNPAGDISDIRDDALQWQATFDAISDPVCIITTERIILKCNSAMAKCVSRSIDHCVGRTCCELIHGTKKTMSGCPFTRMLRTKKREDWEFNRDEQWMLETAYPFISLQGVVIGAVHIFKDITSEKRSREDLIRKNIALEEVVAHIETEKLKLQGNIAANITEAVLPILEKMTLDNKNMQYKKLLLGSLHELTSSFGRRITFTKTKSLTPKEKEICSMIRAGMKNKEIAQIQDTAISTVETERKIIRKKLGLTNKKSNLSSFLQGIE